MNTPSLDSMVADFVGIGLYTPAEAGRLLMMAPSKIIRWLRGHRASNRTYEPLWRSQVDLGDDGLFLGFRDLQEVRVAAMFIARGLSAHRVRHAIALARDLLGEERPLSTSRFKTAGRDVFLQVARDDGQTALIELFKKQYVFEEMVGRSLLNLDYDGNGNPAMWWPLGRSKNIVLDPARAFGQPIEAETSVPTDVLASAVEAEGSVEAAARVWDVPARAVRRAVEFQRTFHLKAA